MTINSLFYNLQREEIEDWTGRGLADLEERVARTPLPALQTFLDDPLRVFRTIRFTARFDLRLETDIRVAAMAEPVRKALVTKVSRERICKEYTLMMKGKNPFNALTLLHDLQQLPVLLRVPSDFNDRSEAGFEAAIRLQDLQLSGEAALQPSRTFLATTAALMAAYRCEEVRLPKKKNAVPLIDFICSESLKVSSSLVIQ